MLVAASWWFENLAPHITPTDHVNVLWGFIHGALMSLNLIYSLFNDQVTIYQSPNDGVGYNVGFFFGAASVYGGIGFRIF